MDCLSQISTLLQQVTSGSSISLPSSLANQSPYDILCLGSGWTFTFLGPAAAQANLKIAYTSREAKSGAFPFTFDPESNDIEAFRSLPDAKAIVIIFPLYTKEAVKRLVRGYLNTRQGYEEGGEIYKEKGEMTTPRFILLGSTGIWNNGPTVQFAPLSDDRPTMEEKMQLLPTSPLSTPSSPWKDRHSEVSPLPRAIAENILLSLNEKDNIVRKAAIPTSVLCLSGLWGHGRSPRRYISVIAPSKEKLKALGSVHLVHGHDVARAILAMAGQWEKTEGQRWLLTNERVYDLWDLCSRWGDKGEAGRDHVPEGPQSQWVQELVAESRCSKVQDDDNVEEGTLKAKLPSSAVRSLPRTVEQMGLALDGTDFWTTFNLSPEVPWVD